MLTARSMAHWLRHRDLTYVASRALALVKRYGITASAGQCRIMEGVNLLSRYGCSPTFPTPGRVVDAHPGFCRAVQSMGAELAVHGYDHVDFRSLSPESARAQFATAVAAFGDRGLEVSGFRCPYLSYEESLSDSLPVSAFRYSSNRAVWWNVLGPEMTDEGNAVFRTLQSFYRAEPADQTVVTPEFHKGVVEIPASLPDDIQLHDGLKLGPEALTAAWMDILKRSYQRGEIFALLFHPESFPECSDAFETILRSALALEPSVWVAQLKEVADWWYEKSEFTVSAERLDHGFRLRFRCSPRATILIRGAITPDGQPWFGDYRCLEDRDVVISGAFKPFIGVEESAPPAAVAFLREQGYIVEPPETFHTCSLRLSAHQLLNLQRRELVDFIEAQPSPLVRFWRWPSKTRSALCITGDLDALCLIDYVRRLLPSTRRVH
jgi:peptidoglycan/xylan/chitin deacetylase (PgdA/CDA1 family)